MDDVKKKMMGLITGFFMGLSEADKQILKSQMNNDVNNNSSTDISALDAMSSGDKMYAAYN